MATRLPPLNPLRAFEAAARHGSVSAAARELNVTHGAVSHQIRALEDNLGIGLFERSGQRVKLSAQGALLLPTISAAFESIASATAQIARPATSGDLTIACVPALLSFWLLPRINEFTEQFPDIRLTLVPSNDPSRIYGPEIDVHVLYGDGNWPDCWLKHSTNLELFPVISPTLLNNQPLRTVRDLRNHVILHADDGREWHAWLSAVDALDLLRTRHHFMSDARIAIEAATYGYGVALGDSMTVVDMLAKGNLIVPFDRSVAAVHSFYIVCRNEVRSTPIVKVFIDWIYAALAESDAKAEPQVSGRSSLRRRAERRIAAPALKSTPGYAAQGPAIGKRPSTLQPPRTRQKRKPGDRAR